jgi:hypothetical protein
MSSITRTFRWDHATGQSVEVTDAKPRLLSVPAIGAYSEARPLISEGLGCLPHQVPEMRKLVKERQLTGVTILDSGQAAFTSRGKCGRKGLSNMRGLVDADGGYGDA